MRNNDLGPVAVRTARDLDHRALALYPVNPQGITTLDWCDITELSTERMRAFLAARRRGVRAACLCPGRSHDAGKLVRPSS